MQLHSFCRPSKFRCCQSQIVIKVWNYHGWSSPKISSHWSSLYKLHLLKGVCSSVVAEQVQWEWFHAAAHAAGRALLWKSNSSNVIFIAPGSRCFSVPLQILQIFQIPFISSPTLHSNITCSVLWTLYSLVSLPMLFEMYTQCLRTETTALLLHHARENDGINWKSIIEAIPNFRQPDSLTQCNAFHLFLF